MSFKAEYLWLALLFFVLAGFSIYAAIKYTVGNNAYGYKGKGDIFVFVFFGLVSVLGCYVLFAKQIDSYCFLPAVAIGLLSTAVLNLNNMRDIVSDVTANKITLAVKLGAEKAKKYHYFLIIQLLYYQFYLVLFIINHL